MPVTESYRAFVVEQLTKAVPPIRVRNMFGGVGLYSANLFFALIDDDVVYLKTDSSTQAEFESRGLRQFRPFGDDGGGMSYYQLPEDALEDTDVLRAWCEKAIAVAQRAKRKPAPRAK
ncbi:MAG TPA: TfoX/Sxy family protein [Gemmatimonadaceae bacterium]